MKFFCVYLFLVQFTYDLFIFVVLLVATIFCAFLCAVFKLVSFYRNVMKSSNVLFVRIFYFGSFVNK